MLPPHGALITEAIVILICGQLDGPDWSGQCMSVILYSKTLGCFQLIVKFTVSIMIHMMIRHYDTSKPPVLKLAQK